MINYSIIIIAGVLIMSISIIYLMGFLRLKRCVLCDKKSRGLYYHFNDADLIDSGLVDEKKIYAFRKEQELGEKSKVMACYDCSLEIKKNLVDYDNEKTPKKVSKYFDNDKNILFFQIKKTEIKPLLLLIFALSTYIGLFKYKDMNSLFTLVGIEGLIIYPLVWIIYNNVYWHAYIGEKGIMMYQNYILFNLFYHEYDWDMIKNYSVNKHEVKFILNDLNPLSTVFNLKFFVPLTDVKKKKLQKMLDKRKVPLKNRIIPEIINEKSRK